MAKKNNIRSIRFSDELAELIDRQIGNSFTEKFENLVTKCVWELPQKEFQIKQAEKDIEERRERLKQLRNTITNLTLYTNSIEAKLKNIEAEIDNLTKAL